MQRRTFLKQVVVAINGLIACVLGIPAIRYLLTPLWDRLPRRSSGKPVFLRVAPLSAIAKDRPVRVQVLADRWDAYTHHPTGPIGSVWLVREPPLAPVSGGDAKVRDLARATSRGSSERSPVRCLQVICPHLGCAVDYVPDRDVFQCPCHASEFDRMGRRIFGPAPRDMDELPCRITTADEAGRRWVEVRYELFLPGASKKRRTR